MYSKGISWIDDCRIPFVDEKILIKGYETNAMDIWYEKDKGKLLEPTINTQGRFPANILVSDDMLNDGVIIKGGSGKKYKPQYKDTSEIYGKYDKLQVSSFNDKGSNSRYYDIDKWFNNLIDG
jgi:hypothetical protein